MQRKTFTSRQFNQDSSSAKRAANDGLVFITDRGKPSHVLLSFAQYQSLTGEAENIVDLLHFDGEVEFEPPRIDGFARPADLS